MADPADDDCLADKILGVFVKSEFEKDHNDFVPEGSLKDIVTKKAIKNELDNGDLDEDELSELVAFIHTKATKLFAIALCSNIEDSTLIRAMTLFKEHEFTDEKLPIKPWEDGKQHELSLWNKKLFNRSKITTLVAKQWAFLAPVFTAATERQFNYDFERSHILPFTEKYNEGFDRGSFGQVFRYKIHPNHLKDPNRPGQPWERAVAVKEIQPRNEEDRLKTIGGWEREASVLQKMNALNQQNIVRFITAFRRGEKGKEDYYLMFEWADGGNLRSLWKTLSRPRLTPGLVKGAVQQILGLATALSKAHYPDSGPTFRHGDLKPENILWFKDDSEIGILKIADWGLAKQHNIETELRSNKTSAEYGTRRYEPPEEETGQGIGVQSLDPNQAQGGRQQKKRSRLYDVWAFGCITLEFIVWLLYGVDGLKSFNLRIKTDFSDSPPFYQTTRGPNGKKQAKVHDTVVEWMEHMAKDPACKPGSTALGSLLELVQTRLLVVKLPDRLGTWTDTGMSMTNSPTRSRRGSNHSISTIHTPSLGPNFNVDPDVPDIVISGPDADPLSFPSPPSPRSTPMPLSDSKSAPSVKGRARSKEIVDWMEEIIADQDDDSYWFTDVPDRSPPSGPEHPGYPTIQVSGSDDNEYRTEDSTNTDTETISSIGGQREDHLMNRMMAGLGVSSGTGGLNAPTSALRVDYGNTKLGDDWAVRIDNEFATELFTTMKESKGLTFPEVRPSSKLCRPCQDLQDHMWDATFDKNYPMSELKNNADSKSCDLCGLFWRTCERHALTGFTTLMLERGGSYLKINGTSSITLSLYRSPDLETRIDDHIQIGFAKLPEPDSDAHFEILKGWLKCCDNDHQKSNCQADLLGQQNSLPSPKKRLPTRVLEVGNKGDPKVYLRETKPEDTGEWLALSHQWGPGPDFYCTTTKNLKRHLQGMDFKALPATFRDAVAVTRALGCQYLWIDSLCIIQGDGGDFSQEAKRMEQVYSGAYCVLAVSRAASHYAGFLHSRRERDCVALRRGEEAPFYICETIDDFNSHVIEGDLNRRGWVLQEHALARRTVFFTEHQTYWECGDGVRCETGIKMKNDLAAFLGDPNFPQIIENAGQGERILRYQDLYKRYSRLGLSNPSDRPMAIDGLQDRILGALKTSGGFGVFDEGTKKRGLLRRSLLWYRGSETTKLERIRFNDANRNAISVVPSWSWMAYTGAIDYITPGFGGVDWEPLQSPWSGGEKSGSEDVRTEVQGGNIALVADARGYDPYKGRDPKILNQDMGMLMFDTPGQSEQPETLCVVLGRQKGWAQRGEGERRCYLILVREATGKPERQGRKLYERVGAGYLPGRCIEWKSSVRVTIH